MHLLWFTYRVVVETLGRASVPNSNLNTVPPPGNVDFISEVGRKKTWESGEAHCQISVIEGNFALEGIHLNNWGFYESMDSMQNFGITFLSFVQK